MNIPHYAHEAARVLRKAPGESYTPNEEARLRGLATIDLAIKARRRRRQMWFAAAAGFAALALVGILQSWSPFESPISDGPKATLTATPAGAGAVLVEGNSTQSLAAGAPLAVGSRVVVAPQGRAELALTTGTQLELDGQSDLAVQQNGRIQRFRLATGTVSAKVAKLGPGERFIVDTPDATIEVRGTAFRLSVLGQATDCDDATRTRLSVSEGVVTVSSRGKVTRVARGERWPAACIPSHAPANVGATQVAASEASAARSELARRQPTPLAVGPSEVKTSPLTQQNDLFANAARARRSGDVSSALRLYGEFVKTYPNSPLTQNARVEIMRLTSSQDATAAARQARRYLNDYPNGFAREEALKLAGRR